MVLVTGASSGIGKALAENFAKDGYHLVLAARGIAKMQALADDLQKRHGITVSVIGDGRPLSGRLTLDATIAGSGRSPVALMGSLRGGGTFTAEQAGIARLDPRAFAAVSRGSAAAVRRLDAGVADDLQHGLAHAE